MQMVDTFLEPNVNTTIYKRYMQFRNYSVKKFAQAAYQWARKKHHFARFCVACTTSVFYLK